jgi:nucleotide-binding universal stress UspA family protein
MTEQLEHNRAGGPILLCFDGSDHAHNSILLAASLLAGKQAVVLTVAEAIEVWEPYDPSPLSAIVATIGSHRLGLDELAEDLARGKLEQGVEIARAAGLDVRGQIVHGKPWRAICETAQELNASVIVLGARGLSRVQSALLGSVCATVSVHARRPVLIGQ